ncbi:hypothetical protein RYX36_013214, partial [Vicia faba]
IKKVCERVLKQTIESGYFVNQVFETKLGIKFLAPLEKHKFLKFQSLNKKFDPDLIRAFYCNLTPKGDEICITSSPDFAKIDSVKNISKSVFGDNLDMANFNISQMKLEMIILHWIIVKLLYMNPLNWESADDHDLYLMWAFLRDLRYN